MKSVVLEKRQFCPVCRKLEEIANLEGTYAESSMNSLRQNSPLKRTKHCSLAAISISSPSPRALLDLVVGNIICSYFHATRETINIGTHDRSTPKRGNSFVDGGMHSAIRRIGKLPPAHALF